jgi:hypothetical protein
MISTIWSTTLLASPMEVDLTLSQFQHVIEAILRKSEPIPTETFSVSEWEDGLNSEFPCSLP